MIFNIIKYTLYSLLIIVVFHYIYEFLKNTLTIPKTVDLVNKPFNIYDDIYKTLNNSNTKNLTTSVSNINKQSINNINSDKLSNNILNTNVLQNNGDNNTHTIHNVNSVNNMNSINNIPTMNNMNMNINDYNTNMKEELKNFFNNLKSNDYTEDTKNRLIYSDYTEL